ncbi:hypothetical protein PFICI_01111 [Pestalotiopsis fici W106-1]|uniref:Uncharacterized protein n=1 Tax=Pestalotiopsis fici (strain W106-1 / CGMCC3.15140) TaxID=1229662 RepID=W3XML7_PESFW|nr:uncharacterized protein PFICI_01111 [Pestalotiopsis fici W106-1]ETS87283.1 hypothetical protein PFICI_01111 [Pestalotiopsis fici W106-1]
MVVACAVCVAHCHTNNTVTGSMADVPKDLLQEIKKLEQQFTVDTTKLKQITDHFVSELEKGTRNPSRVY